jgi:hypothetical protein
MLLKTKGRCGKPKGEAGISKTKEIFVKSGNVIETKGS